MANSSMSITWANNVLGGMVDNKTNAFKSTLAEMAGKEEVGTADMVMMQTGMQEWSLSVQTTSTVIKETGDMLKAIVQKAA